MCWADLTLCNVGSIIVVVLRKHGWNVHSLSPGGYQVLSGEGADEVFGGYLYFSAAPDAQEFFEETRDKCKCTEVYMMKTTLLGFYINPQSAAAAAAAYL